jgi:hypothetical protein
VNEKSLTKPDVEWNLLLYINDKLQFSHPPPKKKEKRSTGTKSDNQERYVIGTNP